MKRSGPLKRSTPLRSNSGLKRSGGLRRTGSLTQGGGLAPRSEGRGKLMREHRVPLINQMVSEGRGCEVGLLLSQVDFERSTRCQGAIQGLHERRKRSAGGSLIHPGNLIPACNACNGLIEDEPLKIREATGDRLVVLEGDPEWDSLAARHDRYAD